jgi:hypothetical protein
MRSPTRIFDPVGAFLNFSLSVVVVQAQPPDRTPPDARGRPQQEPLQGVLDVAPVNIVVAVRRHAKSRRPGRSACCADPAADAKQVPIQRACGANPVNRYLGDLEALFKELARRKEDPIESSLNARLLGLVFTRSLTLRDPRLLWPWRRGWLPDLVTPCTARGAPESLPVEVPCPAVEGDAYQMGAVTGGGRGERPMQEQRCRYWR